MPNPSDSLWLTMVLLTVYSAAVVLASVIGGLLPEWIRLTHNKMQLMISFVGGVMLGIAIFHMIPHAKVAFGEGDVRLNQVMWGVMLGLVTTFFLLRWFHFHQHGPADFGILANEEKLASSEGTHVCSEHVHATHGSATENHQHAHGHSACNHAATHTRWIAVLVGLGLHTLLDGVALASGIAAEIGHGHGGVAIPGLGIFLAVLLHKPLDAVTITSLMHPVTTPARRMAVNIGFALMCPLGAFLFWLGASWDSSLSAQFAGWGLSFSAGVFLCISLSDLLPEMEFHSHNRWRLSLALLLGILAAWAIGYAEGEGAHGSASHPANQVGPEHADDVHAGHSH